MVPRVQNMLKYINVKIVFESDILHFFSFRQKQLR